jgi:hypothetical protein
MLGEPLSADRAEIEQAGTAPGRGKDREHKNPSRQDDNNQDQHFATPGFGEAGDVRRARRRLSSKCSGKQT